jgi:hypothetical protein
MSQPDQLRVGSESAARRIDGRKLVDQDCARDLEVIGIGDDEANGAAQGGPLRRRGSTRVGGRTRHQEPPDVASGADCVEPSIEDPVEVPVEPDDPDEVAVWSVVDVVDVVAAA